MNQRERQDIIDFLEEIESKYPFGEAVVKVRLHQGRPALLEKSFTERTQLKGGDNDKYRR